MTEIVPSGKSSSTRGRGRQSEAAQRRVEALALRQAGLTYRAIGIRLGMTESGARKTILKSLAEQRREIGAQILEQELARLDRLQVPLWPRALAGDHRATDTVLKIMERRAKFLSLDNPKLTDAVIGATDLLTALTAQINGLPDSYEPANDDLPVDPLDPASGLQTIGR